MPITVNATDIPENLWGYLATHLRVMAIILDESGKESWAVFFSIKGARPAGDSDFKGQVEGATKLKWQHDRPLWLIPLTIAAAKNAPQPGNTDQVPDLPASVIRICNAGNSATADWKGYHFYYASGQPEAKEDFMLALAQDAALQALDATAGVWHQLTHQGDDRSWPLWVTTAKELAGKPLIRFPAPICHIVDEDGKYQDHLIWLGIKKENPFPYLAISTVSDIPAAAMDSPLVWRNKTRHNDLLAPDRSDEPHVPGGPEGLRSITVDDWNGARFLTAYDSTDVGTYVSKTVEDFKGDAYIPQLRRWLICEQPGEKRDSAKWLFAFYSRHTAVFSDENLYKLIGRKESQETTQHVRCLQISRAPDAALLTQLRFFDGREIESLWNKPLKLLKDGLLKVSAASPAALVPQITGFDELNYQYVSEWQTANAQHVCNAATAFTLRVSRTFSGKDGRRTERVSISLPLIRPMTGQSDSVQLNGGELELFSDHASARDNGTLYRFVISKYKVEGDDRSIQDGSLSFRLATDAAPDQPKLSPKKYGLCRLVLQKKKSQQPFFLWQWFHGFDELDELVVSYAIEDFALPVLSAQPAGQDLLVKDRLLAPATIGAVVEGAGERREPALIIPLGRPPAPGADAATIKYLLTFSESVNVGQNYRLDIKLQEFNPAAGVDTSTSMTAVVIDANPQLISLIQAPFLQQPGYDDGAWVLARRSPLSVEEGGWELLDDQAGTEGFVMALPAQAIGEAAVRGRVREEAAHDPTAPSEPGEPEPGQPISYRFGQPTLLRILPERLERRYVSAPWNVRRILANTGDAAPGAPLREAQWELLYGLLGHMKPEKAFIAELATRLGEVPVPPVNSLAWTPTGLQEKAFLKAWQLYLRFYQAWQSRLAVLEPMAGGDFGRATFTKNIAYDLRIRLEETWITDPANPEGKIWDGRFKKIGADLRNPVDPEQHAGNQEELVNPAAGPDKVYENRLKAIHAPDGLAGGAVYGFESKAVYHEFLREFVARRGSSSGELKDPAFSSLGGWGRQTARFAGDKTAIKSTTSMGRTHFYAVERIGRIGVLWHRAKHVIEYERTVVPSDQFAGDQPPHYGRPLLRKVREYVEILEPTRAYPDFKGQPQDAPGAILACTFKSKVILVRSSWGSDVYQWIADPGAHDPATPEPGKTEAIGWQVPLWKRDADPRVYPKPLAILQLAPPPDSTEEAILVNLDEPENIWFYTDTRATVRDADGKPVAIDADTNAWPAVQEVDFTNLPEPPIYDLPPAREGGLDLPMPGVPDVLPGFERFTFRVSRAQTPAAVTARYYPGSGLAGRMRTASMMRSRPAKKLPTEKWKDKGDAYKALHALLYDPQGVLARAGDGFADNDRKVSGNNIRPISAYVSDVAKLFDNGLPELLKKAAGKKDRLPFIYFGTEYANGLAGLKYAPTQDLWRQAVSSADSLVNRAMTLYGRQQQELLRRLGEAMAAGTAKVENGRNALQEMLDQITALQGEVYGDVKGAFDAYHIAIAKAAEAAKQQVADAAQTFRQSLEALTDTRPVDELRAEANTYLDQFKAIREEATKALSELGKRFPDSPVAVFIKQVNERVDAVYDGLKAGVDQAAASAADYLRDLRKAANDAIAQWETASGTMVKNAANAADALVSGLERQVNARLADLAQMWKDVHKQATVLLQAMIGRWEAAADQAYAAAEKDLKSLGENILETLTDALSPLLYQDDEAVNSVFDILRLAEQGFDALKGYVITSLLNLLGAENLDLEKTVRQWLSGYKAFRDLEDAIRTGKPDAILKESVALANIVNDDLGRLAGEVAGKVREAEAALGSGKELMQAGQQTLSAFRSVWEEFTAPGMGFNRKTIAMLVRTDPADIAQRLSITPVITRVKQFGADLEGLGLRMPVVAVTDALLAAKKGWDGVTQSLLEKFNFSDLLSDIGGMRLDKLFPDFRMPEFARDKIKITQGFDKDQLIAWANAEIDLKLDKNQKLMSIGPLTVDLQQGHFIGKVNLQMDIEGKPRKTNIGELRGSFVIGVSGTPIMIFRDAAILYRDDKLSFDLNPKRMEMPGLLKVLTDASQNLSATGAGGTDADGEKIEVFKVGLMKVGELPVGVRAELNIPPTTVSGGPSGISNLSFGGHFMLSVLDEQLDFFFRLGLGFYLGKKEAPFNILIFILGGGGYVDCAMTWSPEHGLSVDFTMSVLVSASVAFSVGWAQGFVLIAVGFEMEYYKPAGGHGNAYVSIYVMIIGKVDVLSLITIYISLLLQATYRMLPDGRNELVGTGRIRVTINICRFVTIRVDRSFQKQLARG